MFSVCLLIIGLLGSLKAATPIKHKLDEFFLRTVNVFMRIKRKY